MTDMFFESWFGLIRVVVVGVLAYVALIVWLRISGKRTLSKWNAFDLVATIAIGSILATVIVSKEVPLLEGVLAFGVVVALQFAVTWLTVRSGMVDRLVKSSPTLLMLKGRFLHDAMKEQRVSEGEVRAALRSAGLATVGEAEAVVLETDGSFSVVKKSNDGSQNTLEGVEGYSRPSGGG